jgi:tetratricopeptide (TPR) repeat protein
MDSKLPRRQELPSFWPPSFVEQFEVLGTLGGSRICRSFLVRQGGRDEPLVAEWYFAHREAEPRGGDLPRAGTHPELIARGVLAPLWTGRCEDGSWLGVRMWTEQPLVLPGRNALADELGRWMARAALALGTLHASGLLHGCLRPESLLLDEKHDLLIALGPTLPLDQPAPESSEPEPMWSSPERLQGRVLGPPSDLYSLGTAFYKLATGKAPFGSSGAELVRQQTEEAIRSPLLHNPRLGLPMARIFDRLLRKDPAERFQSANELIETINRFQGTSFPIERRERARPRLRPARWIEPPAMSVLSELLESTRRGQVGLAVLEGEAGAGKYELLRRLRLGWTEHVWIRGRVRRRGRPFAALLDALLSLPGVSPSSVPAFEPIPAAEGRESRPRSPGRARQELFRWALELLSRHVPLVIEIESAELLDLPSLDLLCHVLTRVEHGGVLVLLNQHRGDAPAPVHRFVSRLGAVPVSWVPLQRLSMDASAEIVRSMLGASLPELEELLFSLARGNPLAAEIGLQHLAATGALHARSGQWQLEAVGPLSFSELVEAALARLGTAERACLQALEVLDRPASRSEIEALASGTGFGDDSLLRLEALRLVSVRDELVWIEHDEVRQAARASLSAEERSVLHRRAYEVLLARQASGEELAHHAGGCGAQAAAARHLLEAAGVRADLYDVASAAELYRGALDLLGPADSEQRLHAYGQLGFLCLLQGDASGAEAYTAQALELTQRPEQRLLLLEQMARVLIRGGAYDRALESLERALPLAADRPANRIRILAEQGWILLRTGEPERAAALIEQALAGAQSSGDPELLDMRHTSLGRLAWSRGDLREALLHFTAAVAAAERRGQVEEMTAQTVNVATLHGSLGDGAAVVDLCEKVLRLTEQTGDLYEESRALNLLGIHYAEQGLPARAIACYHKALEDAERLQNVIRAATVCINLGALYNEQGDLEKGLEALQRGQKILARCQNREILADAASAMGDLQLTLGQLDAAESAVRAALELRRSAGQRRGQVLDLYLLGRVQQERGEAAAARASFDAALALTEATPGAGFEPHALVRIALAELHLDAGGDAAAREHLARAEEGLDSHRLSWPSFLRWIVRCRLESGPEAMVAADRAIAVAEHLKNPELLYLAHAAAGERHLAHGNRSAAQRHVAEAAEGLTQLADRIRDAELRRSYLGMRRRRQILELARKLSLPA